MAARIQLLNSDGSLNRWIGERELTTMQEKGLVARMSGRRDAVRVYRMRSLVDPSESRVTACQITVSDEKALVGMYRVNDVWVERLIGFGLLPVNTPVPASGYLG